MMGVRWGIDLERAGFGVSDEDSTSGGCAGSGEERELGGRVWTGGPFRKKQILERDDRKKSNGKDTEVLGERKRLPGWAAVLSC
jgi:hypothetical protein